MIGYLGGGSVSAREEAVHFSRPGFEEGRRLETVHAVTQDSMGFIWFGTREGLYRFDGYRLVELDAELLPDTTVLSLAEDRALQLWIGTRGGLAVRDLDAGQLREFPLGVGTNRLPQMAIHALTVDASGHLWIGREDWLVRLDRARKKLDRFDDLIDKVNTIYEEVDGTVWVGSDSGLYQFLGDSRGLRTIAAGSSDERRVQAVLRDQKGRLWIGTARGLELMAEPGRFRRLLPDGIRVRGDVWVRAMHQDPFGKIWVATLEGLYRFDGLDSLTHFSYDPTDPESLSHASIQCLFEDRSGVLWLGTRGGGVNRTEPGGSPFIHYAPGSGDGARFQNSGDDGDWHRVTVARAGTTATLYLDGLRIGRDTVTPAAPSDQALILGADTATMTTYLAADLDEVAMKTRAMTEAEVSLDYWQTAPDSHQGDRTTDLSGYWTFGDWNANRISGIIVEASSGVDTIPAPRGLAELLSAGETLDLGPITNGTSAETISLWVQIDQTSGTVVLLDQGGNGGIELSLNAQTGQLTLTTYQDPGSTAVSSETGAVPADGAWHLITVVRDGAEAHFVVDGVAAGKASGLSAPAVTTAELIVEAGTDSLAVDQVEIGTHALTNWEVIDAHYETSGQKRTRAIDLDDDLDLTPINLPLLLVRSDTGPYGLQRRETYNTLLTDNARIEPHLFTGQEKETELGLYYYGARYYYPEAGRFLQHDPADEFWNPYSYVGNSPLSLIDPTGETEKEEKDLRDAELAAAVYGENTPLPEGVSEVEETELMELGLIGVPFEIKEWGFNSRLYYDASNEEYILAFEGTDPTSLPDIVVDIDQAVGLYANQYMAAESVARRVKAGIMENGKGAKLSYTGHSLGGGLASLASITTGVRATAWNAAGLNPVTAMTYDGAQSQGRELIRAFYIKGEILSLMQDYSGLPSALGQRIPLIAVSIETRVIPVNIQLGASVVIQTPWVIKRRIMPHRLERHSMDQVLSAGAQIKSTP